MAQEVGVRAAGLFESVGEDRQVLKASVIVDALGDFRDYITLPGEVEIERNGAKKGVEYVVEKLAL
jgi:hypothetical protein